MTSEALMTEFARRFPTLRGVRVLVVGMGRSGLAAARLVADRGAKVVITDSRTVDELEDAVAEMRQLGVEVRAGGHPGSLAHDAELVVLSPGIPVTIDVVQEARLRGIPVWGESELAGRFCRGRTVAITGSNGKSTVTSMVGAILRRSGHPGGTGGNLGRPFSDLLAEDSDDAIHAVELSSFQIETLETFQPSVAALLNLSPDHLDRYASFECYARAKARLFELQGSEDASILNADDPSSLRLLGPLRARRFEFSIRKPVLRGAFLRDGNLVLSTDEGEDTIASADALPVRGEHNIANALAAALCARLCGCTPEAIRDGLLQFQPLAHRLEYLGEIRGVSFYNDSKATNPDSTARALASFEPGRVHLILGGRDKGTDWSALEPVIRRFAKRLLLVGETTPHLCERFDGIIPLVDCKTVSHAVEVGLTGARDGDVVLLAPACASFDQYRNFEERGDDFRRAVERLGDGEIR